ncbi:type II toxin-antitoxin system VapC family toxin [Aquabacterium sp.]|uniref:type II toxin-antitoxin system VapC family toxin n=1 Tax=Aquabacterium sp. TaxID=1872578 RepID=UPI002BCF927F|nr:type II toxin-antitoxin system VapC family toxin [Aquabacterium sp.]HSW03004.1 type II toxin-antitoxin system VapC family toxin [Aquabacterium sp.]
MGSLRYLLDTNILSALAREPQGSAYAALNKRLPDTACTSIVVASEIHFGLQRGASARVRQQMDIILSAIDILPFEAPADVHYGEIRAHLEKSGTPIGANDLFIAAHARALGLTLVTHNLREFQRVPGLQVEDWIGENT